MRCCVGWHVCLCGVSCVNLCGFARGHMCGAIRTCRLYVSTWCVHIFACGETGDMMGPRALNLKSNTTVCGLYDAALYAVGSSTLQRKIFTYSKQSEQWCQSVACACCFGVLWATSDVRVLLCVGVCVNGSKSSYTRIGVCEGRGVSLSVTCACGGPCRVCEESHQRDTVCLAMCAL